MHNKCLFVLFLVSVAHSVTLRFRNCESRSVWIGIQGTGGEPSLRDGGFVLHQLQHIHLETDSNWQGQIWARTWCNPFTMHCQTGDCNNTLRCAGRSGNPPATLIEIALNSTSEGLDIYGISLVGGFNIRVSIQPINGEGDNTKYSCTKSTCSAPIIERCPEELRLMGGWNGKYIIGCKSACQTFQTDEYCCSGVYNSASTCIPSNWTVDYASFFKDQCPDAYSYAFDNQTSTFTCKAPQYLISFG